MDPASQGRELYRAKDYDGALKAFTEAINISSGYLLLEALDHRAATYEKLRDLKAGLRDAKQMIENNPELSKGYLRCAKLLQLKGDEELAMKIYERGLSKVKVKTDTDRPLLQRMYTKLKKKQEPKKTFDPLVMLPAEMAQLICSNLGTRDLVNCLSVSRPWKAFLEASHNLWTTLDLTKAKKPMNKASLKAHFRRSNYGLKQAVIPAKDFDAAKFDYLTKTCPKLEYLSLFSGLVGESMRDALPNAQNLHTLIVGPTCSISFETAAKALLSCPQLTVAEFCKIEPGGYYSYSAKWTQMDKLKILNLSTQGKKSSARIEPLELQALVKCTPNLQSATIAGWQSNVGMDSIRFNFGQWTKLEYLDLHKTQLWELPVLPNSLKHLNASEIWRMYRIDHSDPSFAGIVLPTLETFICGHSRCWSEDAVFSLMDHAIKAGTLKKLHIDQLRQDFSPYPAKFYPKSTVLEDLSLSGTAQSEADILIIIRKYPNLKRLDLSKTAISGVTIKELMTRKGGPLEWVGLVGCDKMAYDAVEYAKACGTKVSYFDKKHKPKTYRDRLIQSGL